jgi:hypothetical protein
MDRVYIETSIVSYIQARPSRDIETAALQQQARDWWNTQRSKFSLVTSQLTLDEASAGDPVAAADRMKLLAGLPLIDINVETESLAAKLLAAHTMPNKAAADALHVAAAALGKVQYLLTLNCRHIANALVLPRIYELLAQEGLAPMLVCTPAEFLGGGFNDKETADPR